MEQTLINKFKNREIKAKDIFQIKQITKTEAYNFVKKISLFKRCKVLLCLCLWSVQWR